MKIPQIVSGRKNKLNKTETFDLCLEILSHRLTEKKALGENLNS